MNQIAKAQIKYLELLKENNLLDMALVGKLPPEVEKAAKQAVVLEMKGAAVNKEKTTLQVTTEEHEEAQREVDAYLRHYKMIKEIHKFINYRPPREFVPGDRYLIKKGFFEGRAAIYKGTDKEIYGVDWMSNYGNPSCEKFMFRIQRDDLDINKRVLVFFLSEENRDVLLVENEVGERLQ